MSRVGGPQLKTWQCFRHKQLWSLEAATPFGENSRFSALNSEHGSWAIPSHAARCQATPSTWSMWVGLGAYGAHGAHGVKLVKKQVHCKWNAARLGSFASKRARWWSAGRTWWKSQPLLRHPSWLLSDLWNVCRQVWLEPSFLFYLQESTSSLQ